MKFSKIMSLNMKDMFRRKEFIIAFNLSMIVLIFPSFLDIGKMIGRDYIDLRPAWANWCWLPITNAGKYNHILKQFVYLLIFPFLSSLSYSYCYYDEKKSSKFMLTRIDRKFYFLSQAVTTFAGAFLIAFIPLFIVQVIFCIAFPLETFEIYINSVNEDVFYNYLNLSKSFALNYHYLYNFVYCLIPGVVSGCIALLSYCLSLFYRKSRFIILTFIPILCIILDFFSPINLVQMITPLYYDIFYSIIFIFFFMLIAAIMLYLKINIIRDEI